MLPVFCVDPRGPCRAALRRGVTLKGAGLACMAASEQSQAGAGAEKSPTEGELMTGAHEVFARFFAKEAFDRGLKQEAENKKPSDRSEGLMD
jgi:hypothetical protein